MQAAQPKPGKPASYTNERRLQNAKLHEYHLIEKFEAGYRNREDITTLPPGVLVQGSQNVLTNTFQRVGVRQGYTLDGQRNTSVDPILSGFDWLRHTGDERHLRAGYDYQNSLGKLQYRYVASAGDKWMGHTFTEDQVYWIDLMDGLASVRFNFCDFWDFNHELKDLLLFVNQTSNIFMWSGGVTTAASYTANTITKNGVETWSELGFLDTATYTQQVKINGNVYAYTGGAGTTTLTGVSPSPVAEPVNSVVHQNVVTTANASLSGVPATFENQLISNLNNQIYLAGVGNQSVYVSKVNSFTDYTFAATRLVGEGAILTLDAVPTAFAPQQTQMYVAAGTDYWYQTQFTLSSDNKAEELNVQRLKTTARQAAQSQAATSKVKNNIVYLSFEPIVNTLGTTANILNDPQTTDLSFPIVNDMLAYDFTDASMAFVQKYVYLAVPKEGLVRIYNMTNEKNMYWEAPQTLPVSRFAIIDGELYGHSYQSSNTFKLFDGYNDDGHFMTAVAAFSFENLGIRVLRKSSNSCYVEGYISSNTKLTLTLQRDLGGSATTTTIPILGSDTRIVPSSPDTLSLGKKSLGKNPLGGSPDITPANATPPKFRVFKTYNRVPYFEEQKRFSSVGIDQRWELICAGTNAIVATEQPTFIKE